MKSVAVLPLVNSSGDPKYEYFSDGLSDELIAVLAKIPGLKVIGRNSSFLFKGKSGDSASIGQKLGVAQLIQGSVLRQGNQVRIIAEMIRASSGEALWSETYDRDVKDVFAVQSEIAQAVAAQLKIKLLGEKPASDSARPTPKPEAHDALLQAASFLDGSDDGLRKAIRYNEEAIGLDPNYAAAWANLAELLRASPNDPSEDEIDRNNAKARIAANKAFALDPNDVDALFAMFGMALYVDFDFRSAEKYARRSLEVAPSNLGGLTSLSQVLIAQGKLQEAEPIRREVSAIDPLQHGWYVHGVILVGLHRYAEARAMFTKMLEMVPKFPRSHTQLATLDILENNPKGALEHAHLEQEGIWRDYATAMALQANGEKSAADAALQAFISKYKPASFQVATLYAQRHQPDEMFKWLETGYANRDPGLCRIFVTPFLVDYRDDPRFAAFCRKLGIENLPPKP
jgi:TolB-like protein/Flp pilus assembly protein TadD